MKLRICKHPIPKTFLQSLLITFILSFCGGIKANPTFSTSKEAIYYCPLSCYPSSMALSCRGSVQLSLGLNGRAPVTPQMLISDPLPSYSQFKVFVNHTGANFVTCSDIGKTVMATVIDTTTGQSCWSTLVVEDKLMPTVSCVSDTLPCTEDPFTYDYREFITVSDNCDPAPTPQYDLRFEKLACQARYVAIMHIQWTIKDKYNNTATCSSDIWFKKAPVDSVIFPADDTVYCPNPDFSTVNEPTLFGLPVDPFCDLLATHSDDTIAICGGMFKLQRRWTVMDWCTRTQRSATQQITVADTTRPDFTCPANFTIGTDARACIATYVVPSVAATDACSPSSTLLHFVRIDNIFLTRPGQTINLDTGNHTFQYIVIDPCGNSDTCIYSGRVVDRSVPTLVCLPKVVVSLGINGFAYLTAQDILGLSYAWDNCGVDTAFIRRMTDVCNRPQDVTFRDTVFFCCADVGFNPMIVFKIQDYAGNMTVCMMEVEVQNKVVLASCPNNITISCTADYRDLSRTGRFLPAVICADTLRTAYRDSGMIDSCRTGIIFRKFFIFYRNGTADSSCTQRITIVNNYVFSPLHIRWRNDTTLLACRSNHPDSIGYPSIPQDSCRSVYFSYRDGAIQVRNDSCRFFDRFWTATSTCPPRMTVRDTQRIVLTNFRAPTLIAPRDTIVGNGVDSCAKFIRLLPAFFRGCNTNVTISNNFNAGGANASGVYPVGTTLVIFTARDECANVSRDTTIVIVRDLQNPTIQCGIFFFNMPSNDSLKFTSRQLLTSYTDNCTPSHRLRISFTRGNFNDTCRYITCADLNSPPDTFTFDIFVQDSSGNVGICTATIIVNDPNDNCGTNANGNIVVQGLIKSNNGKGLEGVAVKLIGNAMHGTSNADGKYQFNKINSGVKLNITPSKNDDWLANVTTSDIIRIQKHLLGLEEFDVPIQFVAADVDKNGSVSTTDISYLRKLILGIINAVPSNTSYRFIPKSFVFSDPKNPLKDDIKEFFSTGYLFEGVNVDFLAVKVGDVSGLKELIPNTQVRSRKVDAILNEQIVLPETWISTEIKAQSSKQIDGLELRLQYATDVLELEKIEELITQSYGRFLSADDYYVKNGTVTVSFTCPSGGQIQMSKAMLRFHWRVKQKETLSKAIQWFDQNELYGSDNEVYSLNIKYADQNAFDQQQLMLSNWTISPNPMKYKAYIRFQANDHGDAQFEVYDLNGKKLISQRKEIVEGKNIWIVDGEEICGNGTYIYKVQTSTQEIEGKLIVNKEE
ncbi:MAG TPA: T9SS type A sorting domain-containing protein [Saprospiraceae bacterium]|nr:T9SS type A sorting domain-containing protein [Saprospiraceae bacterium]